MKNIYCYYAAMLIPMLIIAGGMYLTRDARWAYYLMGYAFIYRPATDGWRLHSKGLLSCRDWVLLFLPFSSVFRPPVPNLFRELYRK